MYRFIILSLMLFLTSCSSAPKPPVVDGSERQKFNTSQFEKQTFYMKSTEVVDEKPQPQSYIFSIHFPFNSAKVQLGEVESTFLDMWLLKAHRIDIRGRTDNQSLSARDEKIALNRALAVQRYLIGKGVSPAIISINYLSAGDYVADNTLKAGRIQNRRVDFEIFTY